MSTTELYQYVMQKNVEEKKDKALELAVARYDKFIKLGYDATIEEEKNGYRVTGSMSTKEEPFYNNLFAF